MKLEELASQDPIVRSLLSDLVLMLPSYKKDVENGLPFFSEEELAKIEIEGDPQKPGLTFQQIKKILAGKGMILKPATFKRYLGMGMIPGTSRIERTGKGNIGYYPKRIIRDINLVKYSLYANLSFDDLLKSSIDAYSMDGLAFIERLHPEALSPLIDWEAIWDVQEIVDTELGKLFADGQIAAEEMESVKHKAAAYDEASKAFEGAQYELAHCLKDLQVGGAYLLGKLLFQGCPPGAEEGLARGESETPGR